MIDVVFFGSPAFAAPSLRALAAEAGIRVRLVVTQPDRARGRGRKPSPPAVKEAAVLLHLPVWQPETLRSPAALERLRETPADLFVVVAYGEIFRREALLIPRDGALNVHPSLLPRYRGSSPIQAAIWNDDRETGVSIIQMAPKLDAGPIVAQRVVPLGGDETAGALSDRLARVAAEMLPGVCLAWCASELQAQVQDDELASYTRQLRKDDGRIDWRESAERIERQVRAMVPWPGAWTALGAQRVAVEQASASRNTLGAPPGTIEMGGRTVAVSCGEGSLMLERVRPEGRASMGAGDWFRGVRHVSGVWFELSDAGEPPR